MNEDHVLTVSVNVNQDFLEKYVKIKNVPTTVIKKEYVTMVLAFAI